MSIAKPGPGPTPARLHAMGFRQGDTVFMLTGYGPHVWAWGVQYALEKMQLPTIPGGGMDAQGARQHHPALQADDPAVHAVLRAASRPADAVDGARSGGNQRAHAVPRRRAGAGGRVDPARASRTCGTRASSNSTAAPRRRRMSAAIPARRRPARRRQRRRI